MDHDNRSLYEHAPCGHLALLPDGTIQRANATLLQWLGESSEAVVQKRRFQDLLGVGDRIFYETHFSPLLQIQGFANEINFTLRRADGTHFPVLVSARQDRDAQALPRIQLALFIIADRKKYESELLLERKRAEQALRAKAEFISLLTHEIRTPLNSIIGVSHLLAGTELNPDQQTYSAMLASASENLMALLNSILDYSKVDSGKARIEERNFDFERTIRTTALGFQAPAIRKGISLIVDISPDIPEFVSGDPVKIGQMITNLVGNAIKFTIKGSVTLKVELMRATPEAIDILFRVIDTGIGIAEDIIPRIFEEYAQANAETGSTYGGTGLGLAIVHRLAALHGSRINVQSELGKGSTFSFTLRLSPALKPVAPAPDVDVQDRRLAGVRVLVADDSEDNQIIIGLLMERWGIKVSSAFNGQEVLAMLAKNDFDLILMDLRMPVLDGYATTAAIRKLPDPKQSGISIIAFSASATLGEQDIVSTLHFQDILGKPYQPRELFEKIAAHASRPSVRSLPE